MNTQYSPRHSFPFLFAGQSQKEVSHNEALVLIDSLLHPTVQSVSQTPPSLALEDAGKCWLVADGATSEWSGEDGKIACWTGGSWRFLRLPAGTRVFDMTSQSDCWLTPSGWLSAPTLSSPVSGSIVDAQARESIELLLEHLRAIGVVANGA